VFYRLADGVTVPSFLVTKSDNSASIIILTAILPERHAELRYLRATITRDILQIDEGVLGDILRPQKGGGGNGNGSLYSGMRFLLGLRIGLRFYITSARKMS
jgi:hypothetical protein